MFYWYGFQNNPRSNIRTFNMIFFGLNSRSINNIVIPHNLHELITKIKLEDSKYFGSVDSLIKNMTLVPLYTAFLSKQEQKKVYESLTLNGAINIMKSILGLKDLKCSALDYKLKFCYHCWTENHGMYFNIEHQVKNNNICYKHNTRLQYININSSDYFLFDDTCINQFVESPHCISQSNDFFQCYTQISSIIHDIFINGFRDDILKLKAKIRMKMLSLGYMQEDFNFISRFNELWLCYDRYNLLRIDKKEFINVIYSTTNNPDPIAYLTLINFLFGNLKSYYEYDIDENYIKLIYQKPTRIISLTQPQKPFGFIYYGDLIRDLYKGRYSIVKKADKKYYEIICNVCNREWKIPQYYIRGELVHCPNCNTTAKNIPLR